VTELAAVEAIADAIGGAGVVPALVRRLREAEDRRRRLQERLSSMPATSTLPQLDWRLLERQARQSLDEWRALLGRQTSEARTVLRELLESRAIVFTPRDGEASGRDGLLARRNENGKSVRPNAEAPPELLLDRHLDPIARRGARGARGGTCVARQDS
jgi:hypothetical protein